MQTSEDPDLNLTVVFTFVTCLFNVLGEFEIYDCIVINVSGMLHEYQRNHRYHILYVPCYIFWPSLKKRKTFNLNVKISLVNM